MLAALRHDHRRRGARAQPQHRLPARLPEAAARRAGRDLKVIITSATLDAERFARAFRHAERPGAGDRGVGPHVSGRGPLSAARPPATTRPTTRRSSRRRSSTRPRTCGAKAPATSWCSCPASARSARPRDLLRRALARRPYARAVEILPLYARLSVAEQQRVFAPSRGPAHRARDQRRRDVADGAGHPLRDRQRARARQALLAAQQDDAAADREDLAGGGQPARGALRPRRRTASACACTARTTSRRGRAYTDPEILRSSLAAVILRMAALDLGAGRRVSVPRAAGAARDRRRLPAAAGARRRRRRSAR